MKISVPGSLMLCGEHAVLNNKMAIVMAIDARLQITLIPNDCGKIMINSNLENLVLHLPLTVTHKGNLANSVCNMHNISNISNHHNISNMSNISNTSLNYNLHLQEIIHNLPHDLLRLVKHSKLNYIITSMLVINHQFPIKQGFNLIIDNHTLASNIGFGSSGAVVIGCIMIINKFLQLSTIPQDIFTLALKVIHILQYGLGSGADLAASLYGGIIAYQNFTPHKILTQELDIIAVYCGYKMQTNQVIRILEEKLQNSLYKDLYFNIMNSMDEYSKLALLAIEQSNLHILGKIMNVCHGLMSGLELVSHDLDKITTRLRSFVGIYGAKISGAGLGDCIIGLGNIPENLRKNINYASFQLKTSTIGIEWL